MSRALELRLRRTAQRRGLSLTKSRRRDPEAPDYGLWTLWEKETIKAQATDLEVIAAFLMP